MRFYKNIVVPGMLLALLQSGVSFSADTDAPPTEAQIAAWVKELGSEDFKTRNDAEKSLIKAGDAVKDQVEKAKQSKDAEVSSRATRVIAKLKTEPILDKMEKASSAKDTEADMQMSMQMMGQKIDMKGHFKAMSDSKHMSMEMKATIGAMEMPMHIIMDGKSMWTEMSLPGQNQKMVQKFSVETMQNLGSGSQSPAENARQMRENFEFTDVKDGQLDGADVYILEGHMKSGAADDAAKRAESVGGAAAAQMARQQLMSMSRAVMYIDKKEMYMRKSETFDSKDNLVMSMTLSNMKFDVKLDEKDFSYTPPKDATVMDMDEQLKAARNAGK